MSYLNALRLHFAGQFQTNVSTVNNDPNHFDNATFQSSYQDMQGPSMKPPNGWFNPQGDAAFRLLGCTINSAFTAAGPVSANDPVLTNIIADSDEAVPAKLVDLDPEQQLVSEIWGLKVRIADQNGKTLMSSEFEPAAFTDIWSRATQSGGGDTDASACYQSVLKNIEWGDVSSSDFLTQLKAASKTGFLSIKFNMDGINMTYSSPDFMCGRITGTIGPQSPTEPKHLILGRHFMALSVQPPQGFFTPAGGINFFQAVVDEDNSCIYLDLGNAIPSTIAGGPIADIGDLVLSYYDPFRSPVNPAGQMVPVGSIPSGTYSGTDNSWYDDTAGIVVIPLTWDQLKMVQIRPLALHNTQEDKVITESPSTAFVRADKYVYRLSPGDAPSISIYAMMYGRPLPGAEISFQVDNDQLQPGPSKAPFFPFAGPSPAVGLPANVIPPLPNLQTDANGIATLTFTAGDPGNSRWFNNEQDYGLDGQVYGIRPSFVDTDLSHGPENQWDFISFLVWSSWSPATPEVKWSDVQPIFQQYANLYPIMDRFLNLADYDSLVAHAHLLQLAFGLPMSDPNAMPVTRDLSPAKQAAILSWLSNPVKDDLPSTSVSKQLSTDMPDIDASTEPPPGGKAAAASRRLMFFKE